MLIVTGAAGFIGSCVAGALNAAGHRDLVLVDDFSRADKRINWEGKIFRETVDRGQFFTWVKDKVHEIGAVIHLGARTDTAEMDRRVFDRLNFNYSRDMWHLCCRHGLPLIYASSAATYGGGEHGFRDDHDLVAQLVPLNPYGVSKNDFDRWALAQSDAPPFWAGLKFFNVYGPNEYHKGRMASVIFHAFNQITATGALKLFRSHRDDFADGAQERDFVYVRDVAEVIRWLYEQQPPSGLYNLGTGVARTFLDLGRGVFAALGKEPNISFIDTPQDIRDKYQYHTQAVMTKLRAVGYTAPFTPLEAGIANYVNNFLQTNGVL
ncbi:MAG: ADP-glyceromanno-heptose 6-epimerase [Bacteroidota bacterium]